LESIHTDPRQTFTLSLRVISKTSTSYTPIFRATFTPEIYLIQKIDCNSPSVLASILRQQPHKILLKLEFKGTSDF